MSSSCGLTEGDVYPTQNYGELRVVRIHSSRQVDVEFVLTKFATTVEAVNIRRGKVKDRLSPSMCGVGYIGTGPHKAQVGGKNTASYGVWKSMVQRCYDENNKDYSWYGGQGVTVADEWLNFQNFAAWYYENHPKDGQKYELDKDLLHTGDGPKLYSPGTCIFLTPSENHELIEQRVGIEHHSSKLANVYCYRTNKLIAEGVSLNGWCKDNGYDRGNLSKTTRADHTKPHQSRTNIHHTRGIYATYT